MADPSSQIQSGLSPDKDQPDNDQPEKATPKRAARVLVADDVLANLELVEVMLASSVASVVMAANGEVAVEKAALQAFDVILMDMQMPVMDGVEATRRIRAAHGPNQFTPILAFTANVLPEQMARYRAAGMNDCIVKPFERATLIETVLKWANDEPGRDAPLGASGDVERLREEYGEPQFASLLRKLSELLKPLATSANMSRDELRNEAHRLAGSASMLGFATVSDLCRDLESACRDGLNVEAPRRLAQASCQAAMHRIEVLLA